MKTFKLFLILMLAFTATNIIQAQTARVQVIHNSPDVLAETVDIYLDDVLLLPDFEFRTASPFIDAPAGTEISIDIAPGTSSSSSESIFNLTTTLTADETYILVASGIVSSEGYADNPAFDVYVYPTGREEASTSGNTDVLVFHGSTDAPTVGVWNESPEQHLISPFAYGNFADYLELATDDYNLEVRDEAGSTTVATYSAPLSTLGLTDSAVTVVASGFLNPKNNNNGPIFGLYAVLPEGGDFIQLPYASNARLQVIHNSADAAAEMVDVYLNDGLLIDDFAFRTASPFIDAPAGAPLKINIAPSSSTSSMDAIFTLASTLEADKKYIGVASGIVSESGYTPATPFAIDFFDMAQEEATANGKTDVLVYHGSTDAPTVDIYESTAGELADNTMYSNFAGYLNLDTDDYFLEVRDETGATIVKKYGAPLSTFGLADSAITVVASGFLDPSVNSDGDDFGLFAALASGGGLVELPSFTVVDVATNNADFSTLVAALTREDLATDFIDVLTGEGPFTVFAPTNDAFAALLNEFGAESPSDIDAETLESVLKMHVISGKVMAGDLSEGLKAETLFGDTIMFSLADGAKIMDPNGRVSNITGTDVFANNGVVHVIDTVILPLPATVVDIAASNDAFSTLVTALTREDLATDFIDVLTGEGPFTVFAPTNDAFAALLNELGAESPSDIDAETLESVLKMHVVSGKVMAGDLSEGLKAETLFGDTIMFSLTDGAKIMDPNGRVSNILATDIEAKNGVVHVIDTVILPLPATVVDIATSNDAFSTLVAALTREDLATDFIDVLTGEGPFTVFAPTNDAFAALLNELGVESLDAISNYTLERVLKMHVISGNVMAGDLTEGLEAKTLLGDTIMFSLEGGATITDPNGRLSNIVATDIKAGNGVVHVIDTVILATPSTLPETVVDIATSDTSFNTLVAALTRDDLVTNFVSVLSGNGPFTVFAPTNAAFADLLAELGVASLEDIDSVTLETVLKMHVVEGRVKAGDLSEGMKAATLFGDTIMFSLDGGASLTDPNGRESNITATDFEAQNGVVHVIDKVILNNQMPETVVEIATSDTSFNTLVAALTREGLTTDFVTVLSGDGPFTVFAPTNAAFADLLAELGVASLDDIDDTTLESVLKMHVLSGKVMAGDLSEGLKAETLFGDTIMFSLDGGATITDPNGRISNITGTDVEALNGVVHVIDKVILNKQEMLPETVVDIATNDTSFSTLVAALTKEGLTTDFVSVLSNEGPYTVFAPANAAFEALLDELGASSLDDIDTETLESVLKMHVISGKTMAGDLTEGLTAPMLLGESITFSLVEGATITDPNGRVINITSTDIEAENGVVHVIDKVILPLLTSAETEILTDASVNVYPNPASSYATVEYSLEERRDVTLEIYNVVGSKVKEINLGSTPEGTYRHQFDTREMKNGMYFINLIAGEDSVKRVLQVVR